MRVVLFFTDGVSLKTWADTGLLSREVLLYHGLMEKGVQVTFITYGDESDWQYQEATGEIRVVPYYAHMPKPRSRLGGMLLSLLLPIVLRKEIRSADLLKTNQMLGSWAAVLSKLFFRKPLLVRCGVEMYRQAQLAGEGRFPLLLRWVASKIAYLFANKILLTSSSMADFVTSVFDVSRQKIIVWSNYIAVDLFRPMKTEKRDGVLFVGRLDWKKNLFNLLAAISGTPYVLDIVGGGYQEDEVREYIGREGIAANLLGVFPNSELPRLINEHAVFVLPSLFEGNPKALLEAMACGSAVVATGVPGVDDVISDGENGLLCATDVDSIRGALQTLMSDADLRDSLGRCARQYAVENCSLTGIVEKEYGLYQQLVGRMV